MDTLPDRGVQSSHHTKLPLTSEQSQAQRTSPISTHATFTGTLTTNTKLCLKIYSPAANRFTEITTFDLTNNLHRLGTFTNKVWKDSLYDINCKKVSVTL